MVDIIGLNMRIDIYVYDIDFYGMFLKGVNLIFLRSFKGISYFKNEVFNCKPSKDGTEITT